MAMKRDKIVTGIALFAVGILFFAAPSTTTRMLYSLIGLVFALAGAFRLITGLRIKEMGPQKLMIIVPAVILLLVGIFLFANPEFLVAYNYIVFGVIMVANGLFNILGVLKGEVQVGSSKPMILMLSALLLIAGLAVLAHPVAVAEMLTSMIGFMLILSGMINIIFALRIQ